jgi:WD40 repeat protein
VWDVRATADGTWAASAGNDGVLRVWDPLTGDVVREHPLDPTGLGYFEIVDRDAVIATNARGLQRVSLDDGAIRWQQPMSGTINDVQRLDDGDLILANEGTGAMRISPDGALRWQVPLDGWVVSAAPSGDEIWVAGLGGIDRLAGADGKKLAHIPYSGLSDTAKPTPEDRSAYVADLHGVAHIDAQGTITRRLAVPHEARVRCVAGDRDLLFTGDDSGTLCVWRDDVAKACWRAHGGVVWHVTPIGDQARIVTGGADGAVRFWELSAIDASVAEGLANAKQTYGLAPGDGQVVEVAPR